MSLAQVVSKTNRRSVTMQWCEVVRVDSPAFLIDAKQNARRYEATDGKPLSRGYYLALWPDGANLAFHGRELRYLGPFLSRTAALWLQTSALGLGVVKTAPGANPATAPLPTAESHCQPPYLLADVVRAP